MSRHSLGQSNAADTQPSASAIRSEEIRTAVNRFLQILAADRKARLCFPFPTGQTPTAVQFGERSGRPGAHGNNGGDHQHSDVAFDIDGHVVTGVGAQGGAFGGPGVGPHGPGDGHGPSGGRPAAGERFGQAVWTNFPVDIIVRPGVRMGEFTADERTAVHEILQLILSTMGYQKVLDIMAADQVVADHGPDYAAGVDVYTLGLFGKPSTTSPWMLQFGGHHLGLNVIFVGSKTVCSPLHTGILPARFESGGKIICGLGRENDKAFDLLAMFNAEQQKSATIKHDVGDLIFGPGRPDATLSFEGIRGSDMTEPQRAALLSLIREWSGILNDAHTADRMAEIRDQLADTYFAWSGPTTHEPEHGGGAYFRIHGPTLIIEHSPQPNQGGGKIHVHTIQRDLGNDYAKRLLT